MFAWQHIIFMHMLWIYLMDIKFSFLDLSFICLSNMHLMVHSTATLDNSPFTQPNTRAQVELCYAADP